MSTHNIGFYEDLTKIIFELSSNIIKYAPYFFCCDHIPRSHTATAIQNKFNKNEPEDQQSCKRSPDYWSEAQGAILTKFDLAVK